mmetsp:Transcript_37418/g.56509  ORF Transcript_37418/g.56509 Transcript_37418/m.56509 type:complete len:102 (+) Transcript_37418:261-566(+)
MSGKRRLLGELFDRRGSLGCFDSYEEDPRAIKDTTRRKNMEMVEAHVLKRDLPFTRTKEARLTAHCRDRHKETFSSPEELRASATRKEEPAVRTISWLTCI